MRLCRLRGVDVAVHASFVLLPASVAWEGWQLAGWQGALWSLAIVLLFCVCIVAHEFGHVTVAQHYGVHVPRILLLPIGGMAQMDHIPRRPKHEFWLTCAGPAVNFVIAAVLWLALPWPRGWGWLDEPLPHDVTSLMRQVCVLNVVMGTFNLLPIFPMDGGRLLRALLARKLPYQRATAWAAGIGKVLAGVAAIYCAWDWKDSHLGTLLFVFIIFAGEMELRLVRRQDRDDAHWRQFFARRDALLSAMDAAPASVGATLDSRPTQDSAGDEPPIRPPSTNQS